jgi:DhnA family fructose-bisphosphate aldolase class Ia
VSYALEGGADGIAIPWPGHQSFETILTMAAEVPVWVKPSPGDGADAEMDEALSMGAVGLWLGAEVFSRPNPTETVQALRAKVRQPASVGQ